MFVNKIIVDNNILCSYKVAMDEIDKLILNLQGLKQKDVAKAAGISVATLSNLLNRKSDPKITTLKKINEAIMLLKGSV